MWKQRQGDEATYDKLINVFTKADHKDLAATVCKMIGNAKLVYHRCLYNYNNIHIHYICVNAVTQ